MKNYLYSDLKEVDYTPETCQKLRKINVRGVIADFKVETPTLCGLLDRADITENYYKIALYKKYNAERMEEEVSGAFRNGFYGIAIDTEAYSIDGERTDIWRTTDADAFDRGEALGKLIQHYFSRCIVMPELKDFKEDWYRSAPAFYDGLASTGLDITVFLELTYQQWEPWNILYMYWRTRRWAKKVVIGTWNDRFLGWKARLQMLCTRCFGKRFLYTERKDIYPADDFYSNLAR